MWPKKRMRIGSQTCTDTEMLLKNCCATFFLQKLVVINIINLEGFHVLEVSILAF